MNMSHFDQTILPGQDARIMYEIISIKDVYRLRTLLDDVSILGVALKLTGEGLVDALALSTRTRVVMIVLDIDQAVPTGSISPIKTVLDSDICLLAGFDMPTIALHLFRDLGLDVRGIDLSTVKAQSPAEPMTPTQVISKCFSVSSDSRFPEDSNKEKAVCLRAWVSARVAGTIPRKLLKEHEFHTTNIDPLHLLIFGFMVCETSALYQAQPDLRDNEFSHVTEIEDGAIVHNERYKTRLRPSDRTTIAVDAASGTAVKRDGKRTTVKFTTGKYAGDAQRVQVFGRDGPTNAERARSHFVLLVLQNKRTLGHALFHRLFWCPRPDDLDLLLECGDAQTLPLPSRFNESQARVIRAMVSGTSPLTIVHGPPGTGKTSTICGAVELWASMERTCWIAAQSNVAVRNIARGLCKVGVNFKIIVAEEFYTEWHEHLYKSELDKRLLVSDELPASRQGVRSVFAGARVVLCTLGMLSNPGLARRGCFNVVPVEMLVVDEASQSSVYEFMPIFAKFDALERVALFGDPKQLPPYGQEVVGTLESVFDIKHLKEHAYFLDTQYRMPLPLGTFISHWVYDSRLKSQHSIVDGGCVEFIDVAYSYEEQSGKSWVNHEEISAVCQLARIYHQKKIAFCVITPYDAQRAAIQAALKKEGLPWEEVFTVDSFQGNERPVVIVSLVRTESAGFLAFQNRMNVMLTRCSVGMLIVSSRAFLRGPARATLVGALHEHWVCTFGDANVWMRSFDLDARVDADLPGLVSSQPANATPAWSPEMYASPSISASSSDTPETPQLDGIEALLESAEIRGMPMGRWSIPTSPFPSSTVHIAADEDVPDLSWNTRKIAGLDDLAFPALPSSSSPPVRTSKTKTPGKEHSSKKPTVIRSLRKPREEVKPGRVFRLDMSRPKMERLG